MELNKANKSNESMEIVRVRR